MRAQHLAAAAFVVATAAAVTFIAVYVKDGSTQLEGAMLFVAFGGLGLGLIVWANALVADGQHTQEREPLAAPAAETEALDAELTGGNQLARRTLLRRTLWLAGGAVGASIVVPIRSLGPSPGRQLLRTAWARDVALATSDGTLVRAADVPLDGLLTVFPETDLKSADGPVVLVRVDPALLRLAADRAGWAPDGLVAYSKVCSHAGCPVGLYQAEIHRLLCPCHQSAFDVLNGAVPVSGPAAWPLPQLPLTIDDDGVLRATAGLSEPVGPGWWRA